MDRGVVYLLMDAELQLGDMVRLALLNSKRGLSAVVEMASY